MAGKKEYSVIAVITQLTKAEAFELKQELIEKKKKIAPKSNYMTSTGNGDNIARIMDKRNKKLLSGNRHGW